MTTQNGGRPAAPTPTTPEPTPAQRRRPRVRATLSLVYRGVPVALEILDPAPNQIETFLDRMLESGSWSAPTPAAQPSRPARPAQPARGPGQRRPSGGPRPRPAADPYWNADGEPCCPTHRAHPLEGPNAMGKLWCKQPDPEGKNGYCDYKIPEAEVWPE